MTGFVSSQQSEDYRKFARSFSWFNLLIEAPWQPDLGTLSETGNVLRDEIFLGNAFYVFLVVAAIVLLRIVFLKVVFKKRPKMYRKASLYSAKLLLAVLGLVCLGVSVSVSHYLAHGNHNNKGLMALAIVYLVSCCVHDHSCTLIILGSTLTTHDICR